MRTWDISDIDAFVARERVRTLLPRHRSPLLTEPLRFGPKRQRHEPVQNADQRLQFLRARLTKPKPKPVPPQARDFTGYQPPYRSPPPDIPINLDPQQQAQRVATYLVAKTIAVGIPQPGFMHFTAYEIALHDAVVDTIRFPPEHIVPAIQWVQHQLLKGYAVSARTSAGTWTLRSYASINPFTDFDTYRQRIAPLGITIPEAP